jgi:threonyl-tRNA synthetase
MFRFASDPEEAALKPVSCPGHVCLFGQRSASHRELPLRFAEFGLVHRDEPSGTLHGLFRLRQFTQDDGHVFCTPEQAVVAPGAGAFYGPKLEFVLRDSQGREWSCGTIQFDLVMPRRFDVHYVEVY